jgi:hypothetical protein
LVIRYGLFVIGEELGFARFSLLTFNK